MYKHYTRLNSIKLPLPHKEMDQLQKLLFKRISFRDFSQKPISLKDLSKILYYSVGLTHVSAINPEKALRAYPSAGAKYPLEIYPLILKAKGIKEGLYHYDPSTHSLEVLLKEVLPQEINNLWITQKWFKKAAVIIFLTAVYKRTTDKYGKKGLPFPFIESGHVVQNIYLLSESMNIGCCAIGQVNEKALIKLLDINPLEEIPIYYVALGN